MVEEAPELTSGCGWARDPLEKEYHDALWGLPSWDERHLFEMLMLDCAQAGVSWSLILKKRANYQAAYFNFDVERVAALTDEDQEALLQNPGIIRNRAKIKCFRQNAQAWLKLRDKTGLVPDFLWTFVDGKPIVNEFTCWAEIPAKTPESEAMSKALKAEGFSFVGPTICYAFMQSVGMVNDHEVTCPRWREVQSSSI